MSYEGVVLLTHFAGLTNIPGQEEGQMCHARERVWNGKSGEFS